MRAARRPVLGRHAPAVARRLALAPQHRQQRGKVVLVWVFNTVARVEGRQRMWVAVGGGKVASRWVVDRAP